jgi:hypothetical protein
MSDSVATAEPSTRTTSLLVSAALSSAPSGVTPVITSLSVATGVTVVAAPPETAAESAPTMDETPQENLLNDVVRESAVIAEGGQRSREASGQATLGRSREASGQACPARSREAPVLEAAGRSREASGQANLVRSREASGHDATAGRSREASGQAVSGRSREASGLDAATGRSREASGQASAGRSREASGFDAAAGRSREASGGGALGRSREASGAVVVESSSEDGTPLPIEVTAVLEAVPLEEEAGSMRPLEPVVEPTTIEEPAVSCTLFSNMGQIFGDKPILFLYSSKLLASRLLPLKIVMF